MSLDGLGVQDSQSLRMDLAVGGGQNMAAHRAGVAVPIGDNAARGFVILASLPIIIKFNLIDSEFSLAMTIMSILFVMMVLMSSSSSS